ncbi:MAG: hypothetical protein HZR80_18240 [Candidatus Heimdallarchaeota archaeon]
MIGNHNLVSTRMYPESFKQCYYGWKKVLFTGTKFYAPWRIIVSLFWVLWGFLAPVAVVLASLYSSWIGILLTSLAYALTPISLWVY